MNKIFDNGKSHYTATIRGNYVRIRKFVDGQKVRSKAIDREEVLRLLNFLQMVNAGETIEGVGHRYSDIYFKIFPAAKGNGYARAPA